MLELGGRRGGQVPLIKKKKMFSVLLLIIKILFMVQYNI